MCGNLRTVQTKMNLAGMIEVTSTQYIPEVRMDSTTSPSDSATPDLRSDRHGWETLVRQLPADTVLQAHHVGAFRRVRHIPSSLILLRILLVYAVEPHGSFRTLSDWCWSQDAIALSHVALRKRFITAQRWLAWLVASLIMPPERGRAALHVELIDATIVVAPGRATAHHQWRIHLGVDLATARLTMLQVMTVAGQPSAEGLSRIPPHPQTLFIGDRAYATVRGLTPHLQHGRQVIVWCPWNNLRLEDADGTRIDLHAWLQETGTTPLAACTVYLPCGKQKRYPVRVIRSALAPAAAAAARKHARRSRSRPETIFAAGYIILVTNLPAETWPAAEVVDIYRYRWQVELRIKRLKQIGKLSEMRCFNPAVAISILYAKVVVALLVEQATTALQEAVPWWWEDQERPANTWRIEQRMMARITHHIRGWEWAITPIGTTAAHQRIFRDAPRTRTLQTVQARQVGRRYPAYSP